MQTVGQHKALELESGRTRKNTIVLRCLLRFLVPVGFHKVASTRNNDFSNRSQKATSGGFSRKNDDHCG